jgi:aryl-alcohol dehydrogenase-like predicted oxidoreductase
MLMFTRQLGQTNLTVSALCFGGNVFGWTRVVRRAGCLS